MRDLLSEDKNKYVQLNTPTHIVQFSYNELNPFCQGLKWVMVWEISSRICVLHENGVTDEELITIINASKYLLP